MSLFFKYFIIFLLCPRIAIGIVSTHWEPTAMLMLDSKNYSFSAPAIWLLLISLGGHLTFHSLPLCLALPITVIVYFLLWLVSLGTSLSRHRCKSTSAYYQVSFTFMKDSCLWRLVSFLMTKGYSRFRSSLTPLADFISFHQMWWSGFKGYSCHVLFSVIYTLSRYLMGMDYALGNPEFCQNWSILNLLMLANLFIRGSSTSWGNFQNHL